jgi:hypothetical protein
METLTLADELALLAYDDEGSTDLGTPTLDYGLAGAVLIELALAERVDVVDERLVVTDAKPLGHPILDAALAQVAADEKRRKPKDWVGKLSKDLRDQVLDGLTARGILERVKDKVMWVFPRTRYPSRHGVEPPVETAARQRLVAAVNADGPVDARTAALCALVRAVKYDRNVFADLPRDRVKTRLKEISEGDWAAAAVKKAVEEMEAAIMVAVMVPTMTVATNS